MSNSKYKCENYKNSPNHYCPACFHELKEKNKKLLVFVKYATQAYDDEEGYALLKELGELDD